MTDGHDAAKSCVYDCNIFFQALISPHGPAAECVRVAQRGQVTLYISEHVLGEVRDVGSRPAIRRKFQITDELVEQLLAAIRECSQMVDRVPEVYVHPDDPDDSHYVNLALVTGSRLLVSRDADLLRLMDAFRTEGRDFALRFPNLRIMEPVAFLRELADSNPPPGHNK